MEAVLYFLRPHWQQEQTFIRVSAFSGLDAESLGLNHNLSLVYVPRVCDKSEQQKLQCFAVKTTNSSKPVNIALSDEAT